MNKLMLFLVFVFCAPSVFGESILLNKGYYTIVYSMKHKGAVKVSYTLQRNSVNAINIKKRFQFYTDKYLSKGIQTHAQNYINTGYDRGHVASDASFDWSKESLKSTYVMSNIVPMLPSVNRGAWRSVENIERYTATQFESLDVTNIIEYKNNQLLQKKPLEEVLKNKRFSSESKKYKYIKKYQRAVRYLSNKKIHVPSGFYKILENKVHNFKECYYVQNEKPLKTKGVSAYLISCSLFFPFVSNS